LCGCQCGQGDDVEFKCKNKVLDTGDRLFVFGCQANLSTKRSSIPVVCFSP
jgi:hypothetical protein